MATATSQIVFGNDTSTTECSDVHIRMIHLRQANKREVDLRAFRQLQSENLFTDMTLVVKVWYTYVQWSTEKRISEIWITPKSKFLTVPYSDVP